MVLLNIILICIIFLLLVLLSMIWPPDSPWSPWWKTNKEISRRICRLVKINKKDTVYELGSGNGTTLIIAVEEFSAQKAIGVEIDPLRVFISRSAIRFHKLQDKITILRKNFFNVSLSDANVVYVYLIPRVLKQLKKKFLQELRPGTRVVSFIYPIDYLPMIAEDKKRKLFVYKIPKKIFKDS